MTRWRRRFQHRGQRSEQPHIRAHLLNYSATHDLDGDARIRLNVAGICQLHAKNLPSWGEKKKMFCVLTGEGDISSE